MFGMRCLALAIACAVLYVAPASADSPDPALLRRIEAEVQHTRGLPALAEPTLKVLDRTALRQYLVAEFNRDYLPSEREADQKLLVALGLIDPADNLVQIHLDLLSDQVIGVYSPDARAMLVVGDAFGPTERLTYAHEFNHALQDQHFHLDVLAPKHPDSNDRSLAVHALIEGDAVMLQTMWAEAHLTSSDFLELARAGSQGGDILSRVPNVVRTDLLFPYVEGMNFVRRAYRQADNSYAGVDALFRNPPESTAQILHPDKYAAHVHPVDVSLPDLAAALGSGWRQVGAGVLGELDTRVLLEQYGDRPEAAEVAAGWSGDRWQLVERDGRSTIVLRSTWQSEAAARAFFNAYGRGLRARFDAATVDEAAADRLALTTSSSATDLRVQGRDVLAVIAADRPTADDVVSLVS